MRTSYAPISTQYLMSTLDDTLRNHGLEYRLQHLSSKAQGKGWIQATIMNVESRIHGDMIRPRILLRNSTDGTAACQIHVGFLRLVCSNGLISGSSVYSERVIHRVTKDGRVDRFLTELPQKLSYAIQFICSASFIDKMQSLTSQALNIDMQVQIASALHDSGRLSERQFQATVSRLTSPYRRSEDTHTTWGVYNVINEAMRLTSRSEGRNADRNVSLLDSVVELASRAA